MPFRRGTRKTFALSRVPARAAAAELLPERSARALGSCIRFEFREGVGGVGHFSHSVAMKCCELCSGVLFARFMRFFSFRLLYIAGGGCVTRVMIDVGLPRAERVWEGVYYRFDLGGISEIIFEVYCCLCMGVNYSLLAYHH